jgi:hypothetical protein
MPSFDICQAFFSTSKVSAFVFSSPLFFLLYVLSSFPSECFMFCSVPLIFPLFPFSTFLFYLSRLLSTLRSFSFPLSWPLFFILGSLLPVLCSFLSPRLSAFRFSPLIFFLPFIYSLSRLTPFFLSPSYFPFFLPSFLFSLPLLFSLSFESFLSSLSFCLSSFNLFLFLSSFFPVLPSLCLLFFLFPVFPPFYSFLSHPFCLSSCPLFCFFAFPIFSWFCSFFSPVLSAFRYFPFLFYPINFSHENIFFTHSVLFSFSIPAPLTVPSFP